MFRRWLLFFCFLVVAKFSAAEADRKQRVQSQSSTKDQLVEAKQSISDTKVALDSLDRVLESSKVLRDQLRTLLQSKSSKIEETQKQRGNHEVKHRDQVKSTHSSREQMQKDFDRELQSQFSKEEERSAVQAAAKIAVREAITEDKKPAEKDESIVVPPPPWKLKIKFPPPPPPPSHPKVAKKKEEKSNKRKREDGKHKKSDAVAGDEKVDDSASGRVDTVGTQNSGIKSKEPNSRKLNLPPPPKKLDSQSKKNVGVSASSVLDDPTTWGKWTPFSKCHKNLKGNCIQRRQRRCLVKNPTLCAGADKFGVETQFKECLVEKCKTQAKTTCVDKEDHFKCRFLAHHGKCDKEPDHMWSVCCGSCQECVDKDVNCMKRTLAGHCEKFKVYMTEHCPSSCKICNKVK